MEKVEFLDSTGLGVLVGGLDADGLASGDACPRPGGAHQGYRPAEPVRVALTGTDGRFEVVVTDTAVQDAGAAADGSGDGIAGSGETAGGERPAAAGKPG